jgi:hypothetical protein
VRLALGLLRRRGEEVREVGVSFPDVGLGLLLKAPEGEKGRENLPAHREPELRVRSVVVKGDGTVSSLASVDRALPLKG